MCRTNNKRGQQVADSERQARACVWFATPRNTRTCVHAFARAICDSARRHSHRRPNKKERKNTNESLMTRDNQRSEPEKAKKKKSHAKKRATRHASVAESNQKKKKSGRQRQRWETEKRQRGQGQESILRLASRAAMPRK